MPFSKGNFEKIVLYKKPRKKLKILAAKNFSSFVNLAVQDDLFISWLEWTKEILTFLSVQFVIFYLKLSFKLQKKYVTYWKKVR